MDYHPSVYDHRSGLMNDVEGRSIINWVIDNEQA
jgi:hypothetical protein